MYKVIILIIAAVVVVGAGIFSLVKQPAVPSGSAPEAPGAPSVATQLGGTREEQRPSDTVPAPDSQPIQPPVADAPTVPVAVKEFAVTADNFSFSLKEVRVRSGDRVRIVFKNLRGKHDWRLDEFSAATKVLEAGGEEAIEFVADRPGTFEYYCSVGTHRQMGMKGVLIVE